MEASQKELITLANQTLQGWANSDKKEVKNDDPCDITGKKIATDLRQMTDMQRMIADKIINDVCFYGKAGLLHMGHSFTLQQPQRFQSYSSTSPPTSHDVRNQNLYNNQQSTLLTTNLGLEQPHSSYNISPSPANESSLQSHVNVPDKNQQLHNNIQSPLLLTSLQPFLNFNN